MWEKALKAILAVVGYVIGRVNTEESRKKKWLELINEVESDLNGSAELMKDDEIQKNDIEIQWKKKHMKDPDT